MDVNQCLEVFRKNDELRDEFIQVIRGVRRKAGTFLAHSSQDLAQKFVGLQDKYKIVSNDLERERVSGRSLQDRQEELQEKYKSLNDSVVSSSEPHLNLVPDLELGS